MNRFEYIARVIAYYDSLKSEHPIYIGDASSIEQSSRIVNLLKKYKNISIKYYHWENLCISKTISKLAEMAESECEFCAFHGDDDYLIPSSLSKCAEFLFNNSDYRTAQGRGAEFILDRKGARGKINAIGQYWGVNNLEQESSLKRFYFFSDNYFVQQFSTHRTKEFIADSVNYSKVTDNNFSELVHCFTFAIMGKSKYLDCLYLVRNLHDTRYGIDFVTWITQPNWYVDYNKTVDVLSDLLTESDNISNVMARNIVSEMLGKQILSYLSKISDNKSIRQRLRSNVVSFIPPTFRFFILVTINYFRSGEDLRLLMYNKSQFQTDFSPIYTSVSSEVD